MINVSSEYKEEMKDNREFRTYAEITFPDGEMLTLDASQFTVSNNKIMDGADNAEFPLGVAVLKYVQIEILNDEEQYKNYSFTSARIRMYIDYQLDSGTERIEKGTYTVITPETYGETVVITAYDNMYRADRDYTTNLSFPQTAGAVLRDICSTCDILLGSTTFLHDNFIINEKPSGTFREVIGYIAMIACGNARIDRGNYLQIMSYDFSGWETEGDYHLLDEWKSPKIEYNDAVITGFSSVIKGNTAEEDTEIKIGTDDYMLSVTNPLMTGQEETVLSWLHERISGIPVRPFSGELVSNPLIEFMDLCKVKDRRGNEYNSFVSDVNFVFFGYTSVSNSMPSAERNSMTYNSDSAKVEQAARKLLEKEKTDRENAIESLNNVLKESSGMFTTYEKQADGSIITYLHDKRTLAESEKVIKITGEAIGVSNDGGKTYPYGLHLTGELLTKIIYTVGLNADYIDTGAITVRDDGGGIIFQVDMDTKSVIISGDSVKIGGQTVTEAVNNALNTANEARNLNIILSNEYQGIPTDYEGNYETFPEVKTTVQVLYGHADVSADCSYTFQRSDGITGAWNRNTRTYTVAGLSMDTGWVDITATYLTLFSVKKRFKVAKVKDGEPGDAAGGEYKLECSAVVVKQGKGGKLSPGYIDFNAYNRSGENEGRKAYFGRFEIEETADGNAWETIYASSKDESFIRHCLYTLLTDNNGTPITTTVSGAEEALGITREIAAVRCTLYAAGGTTDILDQQTIAVVLDANALTHEEVFDLLTNGGEIKGIYKEGNQLYISFSYAKGGQLVLGGQNNGNGILKIYDADSDLVGIWDNSELRHENPASGRATRLRNGSFYSELNGETCARIGSFLWGNDETQEGTTFLTDKQYLGIGHFASESTATSDIVVNNGLNPGDHTERILFYGSANFLADVYMQHSLYFANACRMVPGTYNNSNALFLNDGGYYVRGDLGCSGTKYRVVETENYGKIGMSAFETSSPYFSDIGSGEIGTDGTISIFFDPVFAETVEMECEYQVFITRTSEEKMDWIEKHEGYFIVHGVPGATFDWMLCAKQKTYSASRMENVNAEAEETIEFDESVFYRDGEALAAINKEF